MTGVFMVGMSILLAALAALLCVPVAVLVAQTLGYLAIRRRVAVLSAPVKRPRPRLALLIPAHNESAAIGKTVTALLPQLAPGDRLLVVADNCSDDTAALARAAGAEVTERFDSVRRGKGYALDWGLQQLEQHPPEVLVVIDADCTALEASLDNLASAALLTGRPVQSRNLMELQDAPSLKLRVAAFAWHFKTEVRTLGYLAYGLPCQLMGTGMAFPWHLIRSVSLASSNIVEDLQLGMDLSIAGTPPLFVPAAAVVSWFPATDSGAESQRTRWEHGHVAMMTTAVPRLLYEAMRQHRPALAALAFDFCVPPLTLLLLLSTVSCAVNVLWWVISGSAPGALIAASALGTLLACIATAWVTGGRRVLSAAQLLGLPLYVIGKLPLYLRLATGRREKQWVRTDRDSGSR